MGTVTVITITMTTIMIVIVITMYLLLCALCNLLLLVDVVGQGLGGSNDCDGSLILQNVAFSPR